MSRTKYHQFLKSPAWINLRNVYRKDKNYKCFVCKTTKELNLHHLAYSKNLLDPLNIVVLCQTHHKNLHFTKAKFRYTTGTKDLFKYWRTIDWLTFP